MNGVSLLLYKLWPFLWMSLLGLFSVMLSTQLQLLHQLRNALNFCWLFSLESVWSLTEYRLQRKVQKQIYLAELATVELAKAQLPVVQQLLSSSLPPHTVPQHPGMMHADICTSSIPAYNSTAYFGTLFLVRRKETTANTDTERICRTIFLRMKHPV